MKQYVKLTFIDVEPDAITKQLGIVPTRSHRAGDERVAELLWNHDFWELTADVDENEIVVETHFRVLLKKLKPHVNVIHELDREPTISWIVRVGPDGATPDGVISRETIRRISDLGASINVDMYFDAQGPMATRGRVE